VVNNPHLASALHLERSETINPFFPLSQGLTMSTPNNRFETLSAETLATATGGLTAAAGGGLGTNNWQLHHELSPILHSLKDLNSNSSNNQNQQNQTMMMGMMAAVLSRRD
jgi:hypothetical protein